MLEAGGIVLRGQRPIQQGIQHPSEIKDSTHDLMANSTQTPMASDTIGEDVPVWRETPLDHWSSDIDPVVMAGDEWVEPIQSELMSNDSLADPGAKWWEGYQEDREPGAPFLHPTHDVTYGFTDDTRDKGLNEWEGV